MGIDNLTTTPKILAEDEWSSVSGKGWTLEKAFAPRFVTTKRHKLSRNIV
ncbi:hypothetical protein [Paraburkholderia sediminicola]|nr:hypothetical protein [Paraburkholderia sediminicola]